MDDAQPNGPKSPAFRGATPTVELQKQILETISAASLQGKAVPEQRWLVQDIIPAGQPSLLSGDGGLGKSLLGLQLAVGVATGTPWLGHMVASGPALYLSCEDEADELHRRLSRIAIDRLDTLDNLHIAPMAELNALLAAPHAGSLQLTPLFDAVVEKIEDLRPVLVVVDSLADVFGGNEVVRADVRWFVAQLRRICHRTGCTIVILSHPSLSGMATGSGISGSTHWSNSVRSRLYLTKPSGRGADPDERLLEVKKSNRSALGRQIAVKWRDGVFVALDKSANEQSTDVDALFMRLLADYTAKGRHVNDAGGVNYAPLIFSQEDEARQLGIGKGSFREAMVRLFRQNRIALRTRRVSGHDRQYLVEVGSA